MHATGRPFQNFPVLSIFSSGRIVRQFRIFNRVYSIQYTVYSTQYADGRACTDGDTTTAITGFSGAAPNSCILRQPQELRSTPKKAAKKLRRRRESSCVPLHAAAFIFAPKQLQNLTFLVKFLIIFLKNLILFVKF